MGKTQYFLTDPDSAVIERYDTVYNNEDSRTSLEQTFDEERDDFSGSANVLTVPGLMETETTWLDKDTGETETENVTTETHRSVGSVYGGVWQTELEETSPAADGINKVKAETLVPLDGWSGTGDLHTTISLSGRIPDQLLTSTAFGHSNSLTSRRVFNGNFHAEETGAPGPEWMTTGLPRVEEFDIEDAHEVARIVAFDKFNDYSDMHRAYVWDTDYQIEVDEAKGQVFTIYEAWLTRDINGDFSRQGMIEKYYVANEKLSPVYRMGEPEGVALQDGEYISIHALAGVSLLPVELTTDINNDREIDGVDSSLAQSYYQQ